MAKRKSRLVSSPQDAHIDHMHVVDDATDVAHIAPPAAAAAADGGFGKKSNAMASSSTTSTKPAHFFRPLLPGFLHHLGIPKSFVKHTEGKNDKSNLLLRLYGGKRLWQVKLDSCYNFKDGWEDFATTFDLHVGDFLVFRHQGSMVFDVLIFDPTACLTEYQLPSDVSAPTPDQRDIQGNKKKQKAIRRGTKASGVAHKDPYCWMVVGRYSLERGQVTIPKAFTKSNALDKYREVTIEDQKQRSWPVALKRKKCDGQIYLEWRTSRQMIAANSFRKGDVIILKLTKIQKQPMFNLFRISYGNQRAKIISACLTHGHCFAFIEKHNLYQSCLSVPKEFAEANNLRERQYEMVLKDQNRHVWPVILKFPENQVFFRYSWNEFAEANCIRLGDAYMIELTMTKEKFQLDFYHSSKG